MAKVEMIGENGERVIKARNFHGNEICFRFKTGIDFSRIIDAYNSNDVGEINMAREVALAEMKSAEKRLLDIQLANKKFDAGRVWEKDGKWNEYFPHESTTKDHHNQWCKCKLCKKDHYTYFDYCGAFVHLCNKLRDMALENPDNLSFSSRGVGLDEVKCVICGNGGLNHNISAFVESREEGEKIIGWFSRYHEQWLDYRPSEPNRIQAKIGACDNHRDFFDVLFKHVPNGVVSKSMIDGAFDEYNRLGKKNRLRKQLVDTEEIFGEN